jgi:outer membrane protein OmpA-like peptidoglycan-associated protein
MNGAMTTAIVLAAGLTLSACATEEYVDEHIAAVNTRVDAVAGQVSALSSRVDGVDRTAQSAMQTAQANQQILAGKVVYQPVENGPTVNFDTNSAALSDEAKTALSAFADNLKSTNRNVYLEITGHGDPRGSIAKNRDLGGRRALEVRRFLFDQGIAMNRMDAVSWGEERPAATKAERKAKGVSKSEAMESDRRVDIRVVG